MASVLHFHNHREIMQMSGPVCFHLEMCLFYSVNLPTCFLILIYVGFFSCFLFFFEIKHKWAEFQKTWKIIGKPFLDVLLHVCAASVCCVTAVVLWVLGWHWQGVTFLWMMPQHLKIYLREHSSARWCSTRNWTRPAMRWLKLTSQDHGNKYNH